MRLSSGRVFLSTGESRKLSVSKREGKEYVGEKQKWSLDWGEEVK